MALIPFWCYQTYGPLEVASLTGGCFAFTNTLAAAITDDKDYDAKQLVTITPGTQAFQLSRLGPRL
jgi:hypothetical protein